MNGGDGNVYDALVASSASVSTPAFGASSGILTPQAIVRRGKRHYQKLSAQHDEHKYVAYTNPAPPINISDSALNSRQFLYSYPAPGGEEDEEMIDETWDCVIKAMYAKYGLSYPANKHGHDWTVYDNVGSLPGLSSTMSEQVYFGRTQSDHLTGDWWVSQGVGDDPTSFGTHLEDMKWNTHLYSAAFDIVLSNTTVYKQYNPTSPQPLSQFGPYVSSMRDQGIVCWHRWTGEPGGFTENEIHCVDPALPFIKTKLQDQIRSYISRSTNGTSQQDFIISTTQAGMASNRFYNIRPNMKTGKYANATPVNGQP